MNGNTTCPSLSRSIFSRPPPPYPFFSASGYSHRENPFAGTESESTKRTSRSSSIHLHGSFLHPLSFRLEFTDVDERLVPGGRLLEIPIYLKHQKCIQRPQGLTRSHALLIHLFTPILAVRRCSGGFRFFGPTLARTRISSRRPPSLRVTQTREGPGVHRNSSRNGPCAKASWLTFVRITSSRKVPHRTSS